MTPHQENFAARNRRETARREAAAAETRAANDSAKRAHTAAHAALQKRHDEDLARREAERREIQLKIAASDPSKVFGTVNAELRKVRKQLADAGRTL